MNLRPVCSLTLCALLLCSSGASAATWGVDLGNTTLNIDGDTYADNGGNGFRPGGVWDEDHPPVVNSFLPNFMIGPDTFDLGAAVNPVSRDAELTVPFSTTASSVGVITVHGLGSNTLEIRWRANTLNDNFDGDGFFSDSLALLNASIAAEINGVAPGTPVTIGYDWEYFATAVPDHENVNEDPEVASGGVSFLDEQGTGPGNLFGVIVGEPGVLTSFDDDNDSYSLTTSNPMSVLTINLDATSLTRMDAPGVGPNQEDLAGSEFVGRLTLTLHVVPEPASSLLAIAAIGLLSITSRRRTP